MKLLQSNKTSCVDGGCDNARLRMRKLGTLWRCHPYFRIKISISISCYLRLSHQPIMEKAVLEALGDKKPEEVAN